MVLHGSQEGVELLSGPDVEGARLLGCRSVRHRCHVPNVTLPSFTASRNDLEMATWIEWTVVRDSPPGPQLILQDFNRSR